MCSDLAHSQMFWWKNQDSWCKVPQNQFLYFQIFFFYYHHTFAVTGLWNLHVTCSLNSDMICDLCKLFTCTQEHVLVCPVLVHKCTVVNTSIRIEHNFIHGSVDQQLLYVSVYSKFWDKREAILNPKWNVKRIDASSTSFNALICVAVRLFVIYCQSCIMLAINK